ncbi:MAG: RsmB/NOP family class I SAM-dependent RNA methyltransferase [Clostridiales bacterium]|nr:RsmB/NOP family class I SAM-dependent RNA methyltransferase [Clostridiales bacterium]
MIQLPALYVSQMQELLGSEWDAYRESLTRPRTCGLRANLLKIAPDLLAGKLPYLKGNIPWCAEGFYYPAEERPAKNPYYHAGLFYIQEPSAMAPAAAAGITPGQNVLDICAAPGGKSAQAAGYLQGRGVLAANDVSASRGKALVKNLELSGVTNAVVLHETPEKLSGRFADFFDRILIDAPCSGEGMFRKDSASARTWEKHKPHTCMPLQRDILFHCAKMLKPGGRIVYSTCTFEPGENEGMMDAFLAGHPAFSVAPLDHARAGFAQANPAWGEGRAELAGAGRIWPHKHGGEGHFLCVLKKSGAENLEMKKFASKTPNLLRSEGPAHFRAFCKTVLTREIRGVFQQYGTSLYLRPPGLPDLAGIRVARGGWLLGELKADRFEPSQAFAMGLRKEDAGNRVTFSAASGEAARYLRGESFDADRCPDGWALVCLEEYPLGWAKIQNGKMKNKYLKSWIDR